MTQRIRIADRLMKQSAEQLVTMAGAVVTGLANNHAFPAPTVDLKAVQAAADSDVVVIQRGEGKQPGPEVVNAPGHVGFFVGYDAVRELVQLLGGNQGNAVSIASFPAERILGIRRLT